MAQRIISIAAASSTSVSWPRSGNRIAPNPSTETRACVLPKIRYSIKSILLRVDSTSRSGGRLPEGRRRSTRDRKIFREAATSSPA